MLAGHVPNRIFMYFRLLKPKYHERQHVRKNMFTHRKSIYMRCDFVDGKGDDFCCKFQDITLPNKKNRTVVNDLEQRLSLLNERAPNQNVQCLLKRN